MKNKIKKFKNNIIIFFYFKGPKAFSKVTTLAKNSSRTSVNCSLFSFKKLI